MGADMSVSDPADKPDHFGTSAPKRDGMDETELMAVIREFEQESYGYASGQLATDRAYAIERYLALPYGDEVDGRSQVVDTGLRDTMEWLLPQVLRVFLSGDEVVQFEPMTEQDVKAAQQETKYINHVILEKNDAFNILSTWFRDALMTKVGYIKARWVERRDTLSERYKGLKDDGLAILQNDPEVEIAEQQSYPDPFWQPPMMPPPQPGQKPQPAPQQPNVHDVRVRRVKQRGHVAIENVPAEEIYIHRSLKTIKLEQCLFLQHRALRTLSQLRQDGYKLEDDISTSGDDSGTVNDQITITRDRFADDNDFTHGDLNSMDPSARRVWFRETYARIDYDGDGIAELRKICHIGNEVLANEECDILPFAAVTPIVFPHRHVGIGYDDLCDQPSRVATAIQRGYLDNLYLQNNGRYGIDVSRVNVDDMLQSRPGGIVRTDGPPGESIFPFVHPAAGQAALEGMQWAQQWRQMATGVSADQSNMGADVLKGETATGVAQAVSAGQTRVESVTRSFATGVKELFGIVHALTLQNATSDEKLRLDNEWVTIDPREWVKRSAMTITVGLGTGTKEYKLQMLQMMAQHQVQGLQIHITTPENLYETGKEMAMAAGFRDYQRFWTDPSKSPPPPPQPPFQVMVEQIKAQSNEKIAAAKAAHDKELAQSSLQVEAQKAQLSAQTTQASEAARTQADVAVQQHKITTDSQREFEKAQIQIQVDGARIDKELQAQIQMNAEKVFGQIEVARINAGVTQAQNAQKALADQAGVPEAADPAVMVKQIVDAMTPVVAKAASAPRKRTIVRGADGRASHLIDEPATPTLQ